MTPATHVCIIIMCIITHVYFSHAGGGRLVPEEIHVPPLALYPSPPRDLGYVTHVTRNQAKVSHT
jgi:hypothetical protein